MELQEALEQLQFNWQNTLVEVTGITSTKNIGLVKSLGADHIIDYTREDFTAANEEYDVVYDTIGKSSFRKSKKVLG